MGENVTFAESPSITVRDVPAFRPRPSKLFVETTTRCNLSCKMCVKQTVPCGNCFWCMGLFNCLR